MSVSDAVPVAVAQPARPRPPAIAAYVLAIVASAGFAIGAWLPWVTGVINIRSPGWYTFALHPFSAAPWKDLPPPLQLWGIISVAGLALCPLLLTRSRALSLTARIAFLIWLLPAAGFTWLEINHFQTLMQVPKAPEVSLVHVSPQWQIGFYISIISLALALIAGIVLLASGLPLREGAGAMRPRGEQIAGTGALITGAVIWAIGVYGMPWATTNCQGMPLVYATCTGMPFNAVLTTGIAHYTQTLDPLIARDALPVLLGAGALWLVLAVARAGASRLLCAWATAWLLLATGCALLANLGTGLVIANSGSRAPSRYLPSGNWSGDSGIMFTFIGLLLVWGTVLALWVVVLRRLRAANLPSA